MNKVAIGASMAVSGALGWFARDVAPSAPVVPVPLGADGGAPILVVWGTPLDPELDVLVVDVDGGVRLTRVP